MIWYEVTLEVEPELAPAIEAHMRQSHIPEIFATGCFRQIRFERSSPHRLRTCYGAALQSDLDRYLHEHAPALRAQFQERFPQGVALSREVWVSQEIWE
jgi:hypothetical protein